MTSRSIQDSIVAGFEEGIRLMQSYLADAGGRNVLEEVSKGLVRCFSAQKKVLICGNGGSACDAMHFAEEFTGRFQKNRKALPVISLTDPGHLTCVANDMGFEEVFSRGVEAYGQEGDWLIALSTSGNSPNIIRAVEAAENQGLSTFCLLGKDGGKLLGKAQFETVIPGTTSDRIQEVHMVILHMLIELVERQMFPENYESVGE
ncbi:MAG: SIS domain-containing protein [Bacteroidota bacterium]